MGQHLGKKLKELREQHGFTQTDVAEKLNISRQAISQWENEKSTPDIENAFLLCELYGISIHELQGADFKETDSNPTTEPEKPFTSYTLNQSQLYTLEIIGLVLILLLACQFAFIGSVVSVVIAVWQKRTQRNHKIIYLLCIICFIISSYNGYVLIDYFFFNNYTTYIEKVAHLIR